VNAGLDALRVLLRMALLKACLRLVRQDWYANLPERIFMNHNAALVRIAGTSSCDSEWLDPRKDLFHKELGIATFRLIMVGTRVTDPNCGIPRGIIFKGGVGGFLKGVGRFSRLGGFSPYLQNHIHDLTMSRINEGGRIQLWLGCAEVLRLYPALKGLVGSSWLEDPALEFVAPRLYRDNRILRENGSLYFPNGTDEETVRNALAKSTTRQAMYAEGRYNPKRYMVVWPRFELIRWADQWIRDHPEHPGVYAPGA
jgi:hypothetical protein